MTFPSRDIQDHIYFVTASLCGWKPLFTEPIYAQLVLDSLAWLHHNRKCQLFAFVLMPSHLHGILQPEHGPIRALLQEFGSFTAHGILAQLRKDQRADLLGFFSEQRRDPRHQHSIWQDMQAKNIYSVKFLSQKMEYIHSNPVRKEWKLAHDRAEYVYSSACFYDAGKPPIIPVADIREWLMPADARNAAEDGG